jgi:hypothetical protein
MFQIASLEKLSATHALDERRNVRRIKAVSRSKPSTLTMSQPSACACAFSA